MDDTNKTRQELVDELDVLRHRVAELEKALINADYTQEEWSVVFDALNSSINGVIITNLDGRITYVNPAFLDLFEYREKSDVIGRDAADLFVSKDIIDFADVKSAIARKRGNKGKFAVQRKDGSTFLVEAISSNVTDIVGNSIGRMASFVEMTPGK